MVERSGRTGRIIFDDREQERFGMPDSLAPIAAVGVALYHLNLADRLASEAGELGDNDPISARKRNELLAGANAYGCLASKVLDLCPDEHLEAIMQREQTI